MDLVIVVYYFILGKKRYEKIDNLLVISGIILCYYIGSVYSLRNGGINENFIKKNFIVYFDYFLIVIMLFYNC